MHDCRRLLCKEGHNISNSVIIQKIRTGSDYPVFSAFSAIYEYNINGSVYDTTV